VEKQVAKGRLARRLALALGGLVPLAAFSLYLDTLAPDVLPFDSGTLQAKATVLGIGHPTGYPTFILLGRLFTYLPFGDPAYRVNLSSATYAALSSLFVYLCALRLVPGGRRDARTVGGVLSAAVGALAFAVSPTFWSQAVITEVYTLNALFLAATFYLLLLWRDSGRDRHLLLAALTSGLAVTAHATSGLLPYLYLPIRASMDPPMNYNDASTLEGFLFIVTGGNFRGQMFAFGPEEMLTRAGTYLGLLAEQFPPLLLVAAVGGLVALLLRDRPALVLLGTLALGTVGYALGYDIPDIGAYFIPSYLVAALLVSVGLGYAVSLVGGLVARRAPELAPFAVPVVLLPALLALALVVPATRADVDQSDNLAPRRLVEDVARTTERGSSIVVGRDIGSLQYMQSVEGRRTDLDLIMTSETQTLGHSRLGLRRGTTYVVNPSVAQGDVLRDAGYRLEPVGDGIYRLSESRP
jgi:hypothetical protein